MRAHAMHLSDTCADDSNFGKVGDRSSCCCAGDAGRAKRRTTQGNKRRMQNFALTWPPRRSRKKKAAQIEKLASRSAPRARGAMALALLAAARALPYTVKTDHVPRNMACDCADFGCNCAYRLTCTDPAKDVLAWGKEKNTCGLARYKGTCFCYKECACAPDPPGLQSVSDSTGAYP